MVAPRQHLQRKAIKLSNAHTRAGSRDPQLTLRWLVGDSKGHTEIVIAARDQWFAGSIRALVRSSSRVGVLSGPCRYGRNGHGEAEHRASPIWFSRHTGIPRIWRCTSNAQVTGQRQKRVHLPAKTDFRMPDIPAIPSIKRKFPISPRPAKTGPATMLGLAWLGLAWLGLEGIA